MGGNTKKAAEIVAEGIENVKNVKVNMKEALDADVEDLRQCDGIAIGTPDYFSYMAGGVKDFFDRTYYPTKGEVTGTPCIIFVSHGGGGEAVESVKDIADSFDFDVVHEPVLVKGAPNKKERRNLSKAGKKLAETCKK